MKGKANIFIISGPSGAGEDSIINGLKKKMEIEVVKTTTTREMRKNESQGNPYYFVSKEEFKKGIENDEFAEYALQYNDNLYGVAKEELNRVENSGKVGIWKIEYKGVITVKEKFPEIKSILINTESLNVLEERIRKRDAASEEFIKERMEYTKQWLMHKDIYDFEVINKDGKLEEAICEVESIIKGNL